ncbi:hypothetical protein [Kitasatospora sp. NBC_01300]|uniref:hypothetical protein n=1 Tax=Kitasatospora sp. NBC_01300 TaxID=2903574 RepID=UPI002F90E824|nr:hypothetical protein OG556_33910 [Kitasatospora sp. NBC_01300]
MRRGGEERPVAIGAAFGHQEARPQDGRPGGPGEGRTVLVADALSGLADTVITVRSTRPASLDHPPAGGHGPAVAPGKQP